jgi:hypothetical protein
MDHRGRRHIGILVLPMVLASLAVNAYRRVIGAKCQASGAYRQHRGHTWHLFPMIEVIAMIVLMRANRLLVTDAQRQTAASRHMLRAGQRQR